jgi:hypothetical protein
MPRINEHQFSFENIDYKLTFYPKESAVIYLNEKIYIGNRTELLKKYITYLGLNLKLDGLTTQQLSSIVLNHITELNNNGFKKTTPKVDSNKNNKPNISDISSIMNLKIELENLGLSKNFKVVMICAGRKNNSYFTAYPNENFVNNIALPPLSPSEHHPDAPMTLGKITWRDYLTNHQNDNNLLEAYNLYKRNEYRCLYRKYKNNFYILSAGWGLVNSEFKLPNYNITFSTNSKQRNKRSKNINTVPFYKDFNKFYDESKKLLINPKEDILYVGGKDYLELFYDLTQNLPNRKIIFKFNNTDIPAPPNNSFLIRSYLINYPSFWYYQLAKDLCNL